MHQKIVTLAIAFLLLTAPKALAQNPSDPSNRNILILPNSVTELTSQQAIEYFQQRLTEARQEKDIYSQAIALLNLGVAYFSQGDFGEKSGYDKAIEYFQQSLAIRRQLKDTDGEAITLHNLGDVYSRLGDVKNAIASYDRALAIAREIGDRYVEGDTLGALSLVYKQQRDFERAIKYQQQSLTIARELGDRQLELIALNNLGLTLFESGKLPEATEALFAAIQAFESLRNSLGSTDAQKVAIGELQQMGSYRLLQKVLIAQNKIPEALEISDRGRASALVELLQKRLARTVSGANLKDFQKIANQQNATLVEYSIITEDYRIQGRITYRDSEIFIWVIQPTGEVAFRSAKIPPDTSLKDLIPQTINLIREGGRGTEIALKPGDLVRLKGKPIGWEYEIVTVDRNKNTVWLKFSNSDRPPTEYPIADVIIGRALNNYLQQLHQLLIQPIAELLPIDPNNRVIFIPQRELSAVPFAALQDADSKYLIEKHTIATAPAIQALDLTRQLRQVAGKTKEVLVVGNPTMPSVSFAPGETPKQLPALPNATTEARAIARLFNTKALTGSDATKAAVLQQLQGAKIIHLATHGLLDEIWGLGSAIALAPGNNDDGFLTAEEILNLNLNAELVVLSACNTGKGRITSDGVIGLSRSLISAGVPSVILSLWQVPDAPTAELMTQFYQNLQQNQDKAQALRNAMLATMQQHPDPKDWAAFTLIGEAE